MTEVKENLSFYAQHAETGPQLEQLMTDLHNELSSNPPLPGSYTPRKGDLCASQFVDGSWYRAKIEAIKGKQVSVFYVDYGNVSVVMMVLVIMILVDVLDGGVGLRLKLLKKKQVW